jgi:glycosyltransferase involved in cell wall biosynthesis
VRIAQISPLYESVPPRLYGGTERVVAYLTDELVRLGHEVTLFASGDSRTRARLVSVCPRALRLDESCIDPLAHHVVQLELVQREADRFDLLHFHVDYLHFPVSRRSGHTHVTTLHGRLDLPDLRAIYREFWDVPVVSISHAQRTPLPGANWIATVHHGIPLDLLAFHEKGGDSLVFLGRISPEKRVDRAVEIARRTGRMLRIAAKIDKVDRDYFDAEIRSLFELPFVEYVGEIAENEKAELLGNAAAVMFPIDWCEPFGLVMIESMACGTPVIAWRNGSVPEVIDEGVTGIIVDDLDAAVAATRRIETMSRRRCRDVFEERFTSERMANGYLDVYERLLLPEREWR